MSAPRRPVLVANPLTSLIRRRHRQLRRIITCKTPQVISITIDKAKIKDVIGSGGKVIKGIIEETGVGENNVYYSVRPGDTLWEIAKSRGLSVNDLKRWNSHLV